MGLDVTATAAASHSAFGLTIQSELKFPELPLLDGVATDPADVRVTLGEVDHPKLVRADSGSVVYAGPAEYYLTFDLVDIAIRDGRDVVVSPTGDVPNEILRHVVLGPAFNHLLHQRGHFVLHGSVVEVDGAAVAFLGESGQGKTTTAMAFLLDGHRVLSDDVTPVVTGRDGPAVRSGYPAIKLDSEVVDRFDVPVGEPQHICDRREKHFYPLPYDQPADPVPLDRVYVLADADRVAISEVTAARRVMTLVENTYTIGLLDDDATASSNFSQCASLASAIPVKRLERPRDFDTLPQLVERVIDDLETPC